MCTRVYFLLILVALSAARQSGSAVEQFRRLKVELRESHRASDWRTNLVVANEQKRFLNEAPSTLLEVARADVHLGRLTSAFRELQRFVRMGQASDLPATAPDFAVFRKSANFATIQQEMKKNRSPISLGAAAFLLPDSDLLAEDIDYDPGTKRFFITSVRGKKIISVDANGGRADFARAPDDWPMLATKVDANRRLLWATEVALQGFSLVHESDWGRSALLCFDLTNGKLLARSEAPRGAALGDMVLTPEGDVVVSDGDGGGVYMLPITSRALVRIDNGDFISPQTPAMHPDGAHLFVPDYARGIGLLETATRRVRWLSARGRFALNGIDGLYFNRGRLIAVQNGTSPERVVAFTLDVTLTRIQSEAIIERSTETLGDPTHGVVIDDEFWYIANSGWDMIDEQGNPKPGAKPSVPRIMRVPIMRSVAQRIGSAYRKS